MSPSPKLAFDEAGQLKQGVYTLEPDEAASWFGRGTARRERLGSILLEIVSRLRASGIVKRCWLCGSFASKKPEPGDIDLWIQVADGFEGITNAQNFADIFEHERAKLTYGADIFWMTESGVAGLMDDVLDCLQTTRDGRPRGIVEIKL